MTAVRTPTVRAGHQRGVSICVHLGNRKAAHRHRRDGDGRALRTLYHRIQRRDLLKPAYTVQGDSVTVENVVVVRPAPPSESTLDVTICDDGGAKPLPRRLAKERVRSARFNVYTDESNERAVREAARSVLTVE